MILDRHLAALAADARAELGDGAVVAYVEQVEPWVTRLPLLVEPTGTTEWKPVLSIDRDFEWYGTVEIGIPDGTRAIVRRSPVLAGQLLTTIAGTSRASIVRGIARARGAWREWRRRQPPSFAPIAWHDTDLAPAVQGELRETAERFPRARELYRSLGLPYRRRLLFTGPPGVGKTHAARALATALGWPVTHDVHEVRYLAPVVLWLDDPATIVPEIAERSIDGVIAIAIAERAHPGFDRTIALEPPAIAERTRFLSTRLRDRVSPAILEEAVRASAGWSFTQLQELVVSSCLRALP